MKSANVKKIILLIAVILLAVILIAATVVTVPTGHTGVILRMGAIQTKTYGEGLHFKIPFIESVININNKTVKTEQDSSAASKDLQTITSIIAVNYHVDRESSATIYRSIGLNYDTVIVSPAIQESFKSVTARYTAEELITKRQAVSDEIKTTISEKLAPYGIVVDMFNIITLDFSAEFNAAIEAKQTAQQEALKAEQDLIRIRVEAEQKIAQAEAEAESIRLIQDTLSTSPEYIDYIRWSKWDGKLPNVMGGNADLLLDISGYASSSSNSGSGSGSTSSTITPPVVTEEGE